METTTRSRQQFCRSIGCDHNRSAHPGGLNDGHCILCSCDAYLAAADAPKPTRPKLVEPRDELCPCGCGHDMATIQADAHGMGQEQAIEDVTAWLLEEGADELVRKLEDGTWHEIRGRRQPQDYEISKPRPAEPSPNARARDAAVMLIRSVVYGGHVLGDSSRKDLEAALVCLEVIS